ncbi:MAG: 4-diphosphocytidyl-2C-methyl-D-erythritol kinase [Deltaproteobacteria bacterium]|nr:4-diphosphocytidyl-2C-methyl-D-erythritol kinase [Deltaproteobacteria bacterium]
MVVEREKLTQGGKANRQGKVLERTIVPTFESYGFQVIPFREWSQHQARFGDELLLKNVPYTTIYGHPGYTEFLLKSRRHNLEIRIECKWQQSAGSVDEKLPYLYLNCLEAIPEKEIIIVTGGGGMKKGAIPWLKRSAENRLYVKETSSCKVIKVMLLEEFLLWVNNTFS